MPTSPSPQEGSTEFFYEENGQKQDAALHEPILAGGDKQAAFDVTRRMLRQRGWTEEEIALLLDDQAGA